MLLVELQYPLGKCKKNLRLEWGHLLLNLQFKGVRSAGDSIVVMRGFRVWENGYTKQEAILR